jgi:1-acyl-sn-glycerol-3-phosphate acyltransferase
VNIFLRVPYLTYAALLYLVIMLVMFPIFMLFALMPHKVQAIQANLCQRFWAYFYCTLIGVRIKVYGREKVNPRETAVLVVNHNSFMDTPAICYSTRHWFKTLAKKSLNKIPIMGQIIALSGVSVDRHSPEARRKSMDKMKREIERGVSIQIFPEGTQNRTDEPLQPFYAGAFKLAADMNVPLVPMVIKGTRKILPQAQLGKMRPGVIEVHFLDVVRPDPSDPESPDKMQSLIFERMQAVLTAS